MQLRFATRALQATTLLLAQQCVRRVSLVSTTMMVMRAQRVRTAVLDTSLLRCLSIARYAVKALLIMTGIRPHRVTTMHLHVQRVTTQLQDQPAATLALMDRPTWTVIQLHRVWLALLGECRRWVAHHALSALWAQPTTIRIRQQRVSPVLPASSAISERLPVTAVRVVVLMWTQTRRQHVCHVRLVSTQLRV